MSFPNWTLWGMGLSAVGALIAITLSLVAQSPRLARRFNLYDARLGERVRALTGYALALLLLTFGFFLAGVPLDSRNAGNAGTPIVIVVTATPAQSVANATFTLTVPLPTNTPGTPVSGAFDAPLPRPATVTPTFDATQSASATNRPPSVTPTPLPSATANALGTPAPSATSTPTPTATHTATATASPTPTTSPTPTITPTPSLTPTPISGQTATVETRGSTLWLRRTPGGTPLVILQDQDTVLVLPGHANQAGALWQEISTLDGTTGWVRLAYLVITP
ncbi:MAG: hypothetical protein KC418_01465 [Anaerolineales bacterium]|nr:hypothetical protein [Anaerolineales bacterium]